MEKKIKLFLGGYNNSTNAQNLNCRSLAEYLDSDKFDIRILSLYSGNLDNISRDNVRLIPVRKPFKVFRYIAYFLGILWCDVAYLPKGDIWKFKRFFLRLFNKRSFLTVEGIMSGEFLLSAQRNLKSNDDVFNAYNICDKIYSITQYMSVENKRTMGFESEGVLYLGVDSDIFLTQEREIEKLSDIIFIGSDMLRKRVSDFFELATKFPHISFHIVGSGLGMLDPQKEKDKRGLSNVLLHGQMNHTQLQELLNKVQLHFLPSRSEGFPKVTLETACAGVPSIVYADYGASEWIESGVNGYVVETFSEVQDIISDLIQNPNKLQQLSRNSIELGRRFDWRVLVKDWERAIEEVASLKQKS